MTQYHACKLYMQFLAFNLQENNTQLAASIDA